MRTIWTVAAYAMAAAVAWSFASWIGAGVAAEWNEIAVQVERIGSGF